MKDGCQLELDKFMNLKMFLQRFLDIELGNLHEYNRIVRFECDNDIVKGYLRMSLDDDDMSKYSSYEDAFVHLFSAKSSKISLFTNFDEIAKLDNNWNIKKNTDDTVHMLELMPDAQAKKLVSEFESLARLRRLLNMSASQMEIEAAMLGI